MTNPRVHIHLVVADLDRSEQFYARFFGEAPVKQMPGYTKFLPSWAPVNLALSEGQLAPAAEPIHHLGIEVDGPEAVGTHLARVRAAGLAVDEEIGVTCCYANTNKFWVTDPDGLRWEVYNLNFDVETPGQRMRGRSFTALPQLPCCA